jgi:ABC-type multidrug transport system fused ATPase/permease subunit
MATLIVSAVLLSTVALYNRFPLVYWDTGSYLSIYNTTIRSMFYSLFVYPAHLTGSLWTVVFAQSLLVAYLLRLVLREVFGIASRMGFIIVIALLCLTTSLPWYTALLMPDIFTSVLVLGLFMLVFCFNRLSRYQRYYVVALTFVAAVAHYSHIPIAVGLLLIGLAVRTALRKRAPDAIPHLMLPTIVIAVAVLAIVLSNYLTIGIVTFSPGGYAFELARLITDGQAAVYLRDSCGTRKYRLCEYLDRMPMSDWQVLFDPNGPFQRWGWLSPRKEGLEIISGTIEQHPLWTLESALTNTFRQVISFQTGDGIISYADKAYLAHNVHDSFPGDVAGYEDSRQNHGEFSNLYNLRHAQRQVVIFSVIFCSLIAILLAFDRQWVLVALLLTIALAVILNGVVSGGISDPGDRYGSRLIWLLPLFAIASWRKVLGLRDEDLSSENRLRAHRQRSRKLQKA